MLDKKNFYINGAWIKPNSSEEIKIIDPATEENCAVITLGNKTDQVTLGNTKRLSNKPSTIINKQ